MNIYVRLQYYIFKQLTENFPAIKKINIFRDGASQQFKQRFLFSNLHIWEEVAILLSIVWNFFATSHGKEGVDGLGGTVKRAVWGYVRSGQACITTAKEYAVITKERNPNIHVNFIAKEEITILKQRLDEHWEGVLAVTQDP